MTDHHGATYTPTDNETSRAQAAKFYVARFDRDELARTIEIDLGINAGELWKAGQWSQAAQSIADAIIASAAVASE
ncbi:hypothetical protein [Leifsonia sp. NPDC058248]|uniref:hypothetical protein n=1 Tax=Leifsonia sp. NPDC058248 TaxID=3346402 RepID=UPI0036D9B1E2